MRLVDRKEMNDFLHPTMNDFCTFNKKSNHFEIDYVEILVDRSKNEIR